MSWKWKTNRSDARPTGNFSLFGTSIVKFTAKSCGPNRFVANSAVGREADNVKFRKFDRSLFESDAAADSRIRQSANEDVQVSC
jgi:hypothetical protein